MPTSSDVHFLTFIHIGFSAPAILQLLIDVTCAELGERNGEMTEKGESGRVAMKENKGERRREKRERKGKEGERRGVKGERGVKGVRSIGEKEGELISFAGMKSIHTGNMIRRKVLTLVQLCDTGLRHELELKID